MEPRIQTPEAGQTRGGSAFCISLLAAAVALTWPRLRRIVELQREAYNELLWWESAERESLERGNFVVIGVK